MRVTAAMVHHTAALARLELNPDEIDDYRRQLNDILEHFASLGAADPAAEPFSVIAEQSSRLRADEPGAEALTLQPHEFAPAWRDGFFTVPRLPAHRDQRDTADDM